MHSAATRALNGVAQKEGPSLGVHPEGHTRQAAPQRSTTKPDATELGRGLVREADEGLDTAVSGRGAKGEAYDIELTLKPSDS